MYKNREEWLTKAIEELAESFDKNASLVIPYKGIRVACGFPKKKTAVGECWNPTCSGDGTIEIFIAPALSEPVDVLAVLVHELIHACVGLETNHSGAFKTAALAMGLEGKMTSTSAGETLKFFLTDVAEGLGDYPHKSLIPNMKVKSKDTIRMLKLTCPTCGYVVRTAKKWIEIGLPTCVCGSAFEQEVK